MSFLFINPSIAPDREFSWADFFIPEEDNVTIAEPQEAMFYYFKPSGKYYTEGKGFTPPTNDVWTRSMLLDINGGNMPGLNGEGLGFRIVVVPEPEALYGWPQIKEPVDWVSN